MEDWPESGCPNIGPKAERLIDFLDGSNQPGILIQAGKNLKRHLCPSLLVLNKDFRCEDPKLIG